VVHRIGRCPQIIQSMYILNQRIVPGLWSARFLRISFIYAWWLAWRVKS
jgi:hypothetical protein